MDRHSTFISAASVRMMPDFIVSPYLQIGGGPEWTKIDVDGHSLRKTRPQHSRCRRRIEPRRLSLRHTLATYSMAHPLHGESADDAHSATGTASVGRVDALRALLVVMLPRSAPRARGWRRRLWQSRLLPAMGVLINGTLQTPRSSRSIAITGYGTGMWDDIDGVHRNDDGQSDARMGNSFPAVKRGHSSSTPTQLRFLECFDPGGELVVNIERSSASPHGIRIRARRASS